MAVAVAPFGQPALKSILEVVRYAFRVLYSMGAFVSQMTIQERCLIRDKNATSGTFEFGGPNSVVAR